MAANPMDAEAEIVVSAEQQQQKNVESGVVDDPVGKTPNASQEDQGYLEALEKKTKQPLGTLKSAPLEVFKFFGSNSTLEALIDGRMFEFRVDFIQFLVYRPDLVNAVEMYRWRSTALLVASYYGNTKAVQSLLALGADIFSLNWMSNHCLHLAARRGHVEVVRQILLSNEREPVSKQELTDSKPGDEQFQHAQGIGTEATPKPRPRIVNLAREYGAQYSALMLAAQNGHAEVVELLLEHGADVFQRNSYGGNSLHESVCYTGRTAVVEAILKAEPKLLNVQDDYGRTALIHASTKGSVGVQFVKLLLEHKADASIVDTNGWTCLHYAANRGTCAILTTILHYCPGILDATTTRMFSAMKTTSADTRPVTATKTTFTALMIVSHLGNLDRVTVLLDYKPDVLKTDCDGWNCLHFAVSLSFTLVVKKLLQYCPQLVHTPTTSGLTPLIIASQNEDANIVKILLEHKADPRMKSKDGLNCFHHAAYNGRALILMEILRADPDIAGTVTTSGFTALRLATECGDDEIVKLLADHELQVAAAAADREKLATESSEID